MNLQIFDVEHGACALLTCDNGSRILIDCGHNANTGWRPGSYLKSQGISQIEMLIVTNYDEDHVSGIEDLFANVYVLSLTRNNSVSGHTITQLKSADGMGPGINFLVNRINNVFTAPPLGSNIIFQGLTNHVWFNNVYPAFDDENNLSLVAYLECNGIGVLFPGDLEASGWRNLMARQDFQEILARTNILIASHHGRMSGWCEELRIYCHPHYVVISDKGYMHETQETVHLYRTIAMGGPFRSESQRHVLTTRNDGRIGFTFSGTQWGPY